MSTHLRVYARFGAELDQSIAIGAYNRPSGDIWVPSSQPKADAIDAHLMHWVSTVSGQTSHLRSHA